MVQGYTMNASCCKDISQVLVDFADVVTCPFTHFELLHFEFCKVSALWFPFIPRTSRPCCYIDVHVFFTTFLQSYILTYISKKTKRFALCFIVPSFGGREGREKNFL